MLDVLAEFERELKEWEVALISTLKHGVANTNPETTKGEAQVRFRIGDVGLSGWRGRWTETVGQERQRDLTRILASI